MNGITTALHYCIAITDRKTYKHKHRTSKYIGYNFSDQSAVINHIQNNHVRIKSTSSSQTNIYPIC